MNDANDLSAFLPTVQRGRADEVFGYALLTTEQVAAFLGVSPQVLKINRMQRIGLPFIKSGRAVRYSSRDVQAFLSANTVRPPSSRDMK
jgi:hypothetical protein